MSKADPARNYYADLEIAPDADTDDIRKQFRKLALKYHPDRNPGREQDVVAKFQAIQAASEILLDPQQRLKYDIDRRKQGRYSAASTASWAGGKPHPPPRNPYTSAPSNFPPPPRRAGPNTARPRAEYPSPRGGTARFTAETFANFPKPATAQRPGAPEEQERRSNNFSAWQKMHHKAKAQQSQDGKERENAYRSFANGPPPNVPPRPGAYGADVPKPAMGRSNTTRVPKKGGFDPAMPGADEPQAGGTSAYYTNARHDRPAPPPRGSTDMPSTPGQFWSPADDVPFSEGRSRSRQPYHGAVGERTPNSPQVNLGRSASTRTSPHRPNPSDKPFSPGAGDSAGKPRPARSLSPASRKSYQDGYGQQADPSNPPRARGGNATKPFAFDHYESSDEDSPPSNRPSPAYAPQNTQTDGSSNGRKASDARQQGSIFTMPIDDEMFAPKQPPPQFKSRSSESINTTFSPSDWHGKFQGAGGYFAPPPDVNGRSKVSPGRGRSSAQPSPAPQTGAMGPPPPPPIPPPGNFSSQASPVNVNDQPTNPAPVKFSPAEWQQQFKDASFVLPKPEESPTRAQSSSRPLKTPRARKGSSKPPKPATVNDASEEPELVNGSASNPDSGDGSAMDIDEDLPPLNGSNLSSNGSHKSPRKVTVTPDKPEWRDGLGAQPPPGTSTTNPEMSDRRTAFGMGSFSHVAPFGSGSGTTSRGISPGSGLNHISDLGADLPFKSAPARDHPQKVFAKNNEILVPKPPRPPVEPQRISKQSWTEHIKQLSHYMSYWTEYNAAMVRHFVDRETEVQNICRAFADPHNNSNMTALKDAGRFAWLGAVGDTAQGGFDSYLLGLRDDEQVREHWTVACEKHRECMQRCLSLRERVLREAEAGRLPEV